jgi:hypothetical protein
MARRKKRNPFKGLIVFVVILLIICLPVGAAYLLLFDNTTIEVEKDPSFSIEKVGQEIVVDSFDDVKETHKLSFVLKENMLNQALISATGDLISQIPVAKQAYIIIEENSYNFYIELSLPAFQSRVCLETVLSYKEETFFFTIKDVKVGMLGGFDFLLDYFVNDGMLNEILKSTGLSINSDLANRQLSYKMSDLTKDLKNMGAIDGESLYSSMIEEFITNENLLSYEFYNNHQLSVHVNLELLHTNELYDSTYDLKLDIDSVKENVESYIEANPDFIKNDANIKTLFENEFKSTFASSLQGYPTVKEIINDQIEAKFALGSMPLEGFDVFVTEEEVNDFLKMSNILGNTYVFHRNEDGHHKVNYITADNFYVNFHNDVSESYADFVIGLNINGYETIATINCPMTSSSAGELIFDLEHADFKFGQLDISAGIEEQFIKYLAEGLSNSDDDTIHLDTATNNVVVDVYNALEGTVASEYIKNYCNVDTSVYGESFETTNSGIKIAISMK